jgi:hypothetical protein
MMGLVVVVLLVTISIFFVVVLQSKPTGPPVVDVYADASLANKLLITLLETDAACGKGVTMRDLALDCVRIRSGVGQESSYLCGGLESCEAFSANTLTILNRTLDTWHYRYNFTFSYTTATEATVLMAEGTAGCADNTPGSIEGIQLIPFYRTMPAAVKSTAVTLRICAT